jgi:hypothetical protein
MAVHEFKRKPKPQVEHRSFSKPDEVRAFERGKVEVVSLGETTFGRAVFEPGWRWSSHVKPLAKTNSCQTSHLNLHISGRLHVLMDDGKEYEFGPGDISELPPGHDAWVVGNDPVVVIDISGMEHYAERKK